MPRGGGAAARSRWYSASTWLALATVLVYVIFTFGFPLIPITITAGSMEDLLLYVAPAVGVVVWVAAMAVRVFVRKNRQLLIWTALRYGVLAFGGTGLLFIPLGLASPGYIRKTEQFRRQMQQKADIASIRAWADAYQPTPDDNRTIGGKDVFVSREKWPECIRRLDPEMVLYTPDKRCVHIIFGGGFGHWGLSVGPKGVPALGREYKLPLEDGAWVWHEIQ